MTVTVYKGNGFYTGQLRIIGAIQASADTSLLEAKFDHPDDGLQKAIANTEQAVTTANTALNALVTNKFLSQTEGGSAVLKTDYDDIDENLARLRVAFKPSLRTGYVWGNTEGPGNFGDVEQAVPFAVGEHGSHVQLFGKISTWSEGYSTCYLTIFYGLTDQGPWFRSSHGMFILTKDTVGVDQNDDEFSISFETTAPYVLVVAEEDSTSGVMQYSVVL